MRRTASSALVSRLSVSCDYGFRNCDREKNEIVKHCWEAVPNYSCDQKNVGYRENRLIPRKIKETIHFLRSPNHFNEISYMFSEV